MKQVYAFDNRIIPESFHIPAVVYEKLYRVTQYYQKNQ